VAALVLGPALTARQPAGQAQDPEFAQLVRQWTTRPEFLSPLVDHLPRVEGIPTPRDVLGYHVGAPNTLTYTSQAYAYYRRLAAATPRVKVTTIGKTDEGREILVVYIGSEDSLRNLETHRVNLARLADPRGLGDSQAGEIVAATKPIYFLSGGLHSGETGPPEMLMELAYRLAVEDSPLIRHIRDNVIVAVLPVAEPDGRDRYVDWYYKHLIDISEERDRITGPPYWGKYVHHDNNRDINYSQVTMRSVLEWYLQWHPPIMHDLHESMPFMYTFSGQAPQNPTLDPLLYAELPWFANFEMAQMTRFGMPGVWTHGFVDMWSPGYLAFMSSNHNGMIRMYETFGNGGATTMRRRVVASEVAGASNQTTREWYRPLPPYKEVLWSMRNNTNYMQTGVLSALQLASEFPSVVLENFYVKSRNSIESGKREAPYGFVIPAAQRDPTRVALIVNLLRRQGIEVGRARAAFHAGSDRFSSGDFVIKRDQPYGRLAKILLETQEYPDPSLRTYDDTAWTMGWMLHVDVKPVADQTILDVATDPVTTDWKPLGAINGERGAAVLIVPNHGSNDLATLRYRLKDLDVRASEEPITIGSLDIPAGSFFVSTGQHGRDVVAAVRSQLEPLALAASGLARMPDVATHAVDLPRVAIFSTWGNTQDVGWVRHAFDTFEVPFDLIYKERVREGSLARDYDVILVPNQGRGSAKTLVLDVESKGKPIDYRKSDRFRSLGMYGESDDISGGIGLEGVLELERFVEQGGVLVTLASSSYLPPEYGILRHINAQRPTPLFYAPGPIVQAEILQPLHPLVYGYRTRTIPVRYGNGPLLSVPDEDRDQQVVMRYPGGDASVLGGLMRNAGEIRNRPAIVDVPQGRGRIVLFAGNPCYRWQNHGEFGMLFNAILHWNDRPAPERTARATAGGR
jgi:hypothetical protein